MMFKILSSVVMIVSFCLYFINRIGMDVIKKYIHLFTLGFALFMVFIGIANMQGSYESRDFICVPGYVTDITGSRHFSSKQVRTEYSCTINYTFIDGYDYSCTQSGLLERPDEHLTEVWVSPDNSEVHMSSPKSAFTSSIIDFLIAIVFFVLTIPLYIRYKRIYKCGNYSSISRKAA